MKFGVSACFSIIDRPGRSLAPKLPESQAHSAFADTLDVGTASDFRPILVNPAPDRDGADFTALPKSHGLGRAARRSLMTMAKR
jgi:hypothetical protein